MGRSTRFEGLWLEMMLRRERTNTSGARGILRGESRCGRKAEPWDCAGFGWGFNEIVPVWRCFLYEQPIKYGPEQASGPRNKTTTRADLSSLNVARGSNTS